MNGQRFSEGDNKRTTTRGVGGRGICYTVRHENEELGDGRVRGGLRGEEWIAVRACVDGLHIASDEGATKK